MQHSERSIKIKWNLRHRRLEMIQINDENFKRKNMCSKSVFGVVTTRCNKCCSSTWHRDKQFLNVCLWKRIPQCLYPQRKIVFRNCRTWITSETPTKQIPHVLNKRHIQRVRKPKKKLHLLGWTEVSNSLFNTWACIILLNDSSRDALKEGNDFGL